MLDPVGFLVPAGLPRVAPWNFQRRRLSELKHGHVSKLATMGSNPKITGKLPGYLSPSAGIFSIATRSTARSTASTSRGGF